MRYIYILHFDLPLHRAEHYAGVTANLPARLYAHALGAGSRLTRHLFKIGRNWQLASLALASDEAGRRLEKRLKERHATPEFCPICTGDACKRIPETVPYDVRLLRFPTRSATIRALEDFIPAVTPTADIHVETCDPRTHNLDQVSVAIRQLQKHDKDALGFIPTGGDAGLSVLFRRNNIHIARCGQDIIGYAATCQNHTNQTLTILQLCVRDDARLIGIGTQLVQHVSLIQPRTICHVRDDLAANHFWKAVGFSLLSSAPHKTSGNILNFYERTKPCESTSTPKNSPTGQKSSSSENESEEKSTMP